MKTTRFSGAGFTLVELMVTIALVAVLMMVAVPSFVTFQRNAELTSFANSLLAAANAARGEAMKRGRYAMVVPLDATNWSSGWVVFVDVDRSQGYASASDVTIQTKEAAPAFLTISGTSGSTGATPPYIMFDASGYAKNKANAFASSTLEISRNDVTGAELLKQTRRFKVDPSGRARVCTPNTSTDVQCPQ